MHHVDRNRVILMHHVDRNRVILHHHRVCHLRRNRLSEILDHSNGNDK